MKPLGVVACLFLLLACAACTAGRGGASGQPTALPVVTYTPKPGTPIPADLVEASPFELRVSVRSGVACFTMVGGSGEPVDWPAGYSAVRAANGTLDVRTRAGHLVRTGGSQLLEIYAVQSAGDACSKRGQNVTVVLDLRRSASSPATFA
jgi:hypothetical protein